MANALATQHRDMTARKKHLAIFATLSGNYTLGGETIDLTTVTNPKVISNGKPAAQASYGYVISVPAGYTAKLTRGTTMKNWKLQFYTAAGNELGAGAYPGALTATPTELEFEGPKGNF